MAPQHDDHTPRTAVAPETHRVHDQPPPLVGHDVFGADLALVEAVGRSDAAECLDELRELGLLAGTEAAQDLGRAANASPPVLRTHDRYGHRVDVVDYHPAYLDRVERAGQVTRWQRRAASRYEELRSRTTPGVRPV